MINDLLLQLGPASLIVGAIYGVIGNRTDALFSEKIKQLRERLRKSDKPVNHDLQRAFRRSSLQALQAVCDAYSDDSTRNQQERSWTKRFQRMLNKELDKVEKSHFVPPASEVDDKLELLFGSSDEVIEGRVIKLREILADEVTKEMSTLAPEMPPTFADFVRRPPASLHGSDSDSPDWFSYLCAFFAEQVKHNQVVANILQSQLLAGLNIDVEHISVGLNKMSDGMVERLDAIREQLDVLPEMQMDLKDILQILRQPPTAHKSQADIEQLEQFLAELIDQRFLTVNDPEFAALVASSGLSQAAEEMFRRAGPIYPTILATYECSKHLLDSEDTILLEEFKNRIYRRQMRYLSQIAAKSTYGEDSESSQLQIHFSKQLQRAIQFRIKSLRGDTVSSRDWLDYRFDFPKVWDIPGDLFYTSDNNAWVRPSGEELYVGITAFGKGLGFAVSIDLPEVGTKFEVWSNTLIKFMNGSKSICVNVHPSATVIEVNDALKTDPTLINFDPYGKGWLFRLRTMSPINTDNYKSRNYRSAEEQFNTIN